MKVDMDFTALPPERKLEIVKEMGFTAFWEQHQPDCYWLHDNGNRCICIPPGTSWSAPRDVKEYMKETHADLVNRRGSKR